MSYKAYLIQQFNYTHENQFFIEFSNTLKEKYNSLDGENILIGNLSVGGNQLDAVFISRGQISVIDFKNYGGKLTFAENNPWSIVNEQGKLTFVSGGGPIRNPYQQVKTYRRALFEFLCAHKDNILDTNHENVKWDHTGCIVLFQKSIVFDESTIPTTMKYFHIADCNSIYFLLSSITSPYLNLNDREILRIIETLNIKQENLIGNINFEIAPIPVPSNAKHNLELIKKLIPEHIEQNEIKKILLYYQILISLERFKEPDVINPSNIPFDISQHTSDCQIHIATVNNFHNVYLQNLIETFPRRIFIGINLLIENVEKTLFYYTINPIDVQNNIISFDLNNFLFYRKGIENLGLGEDILDDLSQELELQSTLDEKLTCIQNKLTQNTVLSGNLKLGLTSENTYTVQLDSELKKLKRIPLITNTLFNQFIKNETIYGNNGELIIEKFLNITDLNSMQRKAVEISFKNPLSVITGPPGTGKTQVVLNIIANAIFNNHKILFASKNNKAVDNVIERFSKLLNERYVLRFGSRDETITQTIPLIENFINRSKNQPFEFDENHFKEVLTNHNNLFSELQSNRKKLDRIAELKSIISKNEDELNNISNDIENLTNSFSKTEIDIFVNNKLTIKYDINELNYLLNELSKYSNNIITRILFYLFKKKGIIIKVVSINKQQDRTIYEYVSKEMPYFKTNASLFKSIKDNLNFLIDLRVKEIKFKNLENDMKNKDEELSLFKNELGDLESAREDIKTRIIEIEERLKSLSIELLNLKIQQKLNQLDLTAIQSFRNSIPANEIWRDEDVDEFYRKCLNFLKNFTAITVTSLSIKNSFALRDKMFDLLIIDEASQCDIASVLPLLFRAKRIVVIGDPLQLSHITSVKKYEEGYLREKLNLNKFGLNYVEKSLYDYCNDMTVKSKIESVFLNEHYRSHKDIIKFSSDNFYERRLGQSLEVKTKVDDFIYEPKGINWINVNGQMQQNRNINRDEIVVSIAKARELRQKYPNSTIGIITPFRHQREELERSLNLEEKRFFIPDTVHRYQGDERDIIIYSLVIAFNRPFAANFVNKDVNLINVAITRAKSSLIIVGNHNFCKGLRTNTSLYYLANYVENLGKMI